MKKARLLIIAMITITACTSKPAEKNIYTDDALTKYSRELQGSLFLVFPEFREKPLKWFDSIPENRLKEVLSGSKLKLDARPGEYFVFQAGVWAIKSDITDIQVDFTDLAAG